MSQFDPTLEEEYRKAQNQRNLLIARILYLANSTFMLGFVAWDFSVDAVGAIATLPIRGVAAAFSLSIFGLSFIPALHPYTLLLTYFTALSGHLAQSIILVTLNNGIIFGTTALTFFPVGLIAFAPTTRSMLSIGALGFFLIPNGVMFLAQTDQFLRVNANVFLVATCLLFYVLGLLIDRGRRAMFNLEKTLEQQATCDSLTGVANRRYFMEIGNREFLRARRYYKPLSVILFDIDHFKRVNDTYGHPIGDEVLIALTQLSSRVVRHTDILGRLGGEEFGVILPETDLVGAQCVAERLRIAVSQMVMPLDQGSLTLTVSIGVCVLSDQEKDLAMMIKSADEALYSAKRGGRNRVVMAEKQV